MCSATVPAPHRGELLTLKEAAAFLKRKPCTLYAWRHKRRNPIPNVEIGGRIFYRLRDLENFITK